jgi:hypothetical protein
MSDKITELTYGKFRSMLSGEHRYDKIFCQLVDGGMDPAEAAEKAKVLVKEPVKPL